MKYDKKNERGPAFLRWSKQVKIRDHFQCVLDDQRGIYLESHHLYNWSSYPEHRYDISMGVTLCKYHHDNFHEIFGKGNNTPEQFEEYREICEALIAQIEKELTTKNMVKNIIKQCREDGYYDGYTA